MKISGNVCLKCKIKELTYFFFWLSSTGRVVDNSVFLHLALWVCPRHTETSSRNVRRHKVTRRRGGGGRRCRFSSPCRKQRKCKFCIHSILDSHKYKQKCISSTILVGPGLDTSDLDNIKYKLRWSIHYFKQKL